MRQPAPICAGDGNTRRRPAALKISPSTALAAMMPCGPGPVGLTPWHTRQSLSTPAWPCRSIITWLSRASRLGNSACGLLWQFEHSTPPWPRLLR